MRPKRQPSPHLCCEWGRGLDSQFYSSQLWESQLVEWPGKGITRLLDLSVSLLLMPKDKGQCLSSPTCLPHLHCHCLSSVLHRFLDFCRTPDWSPHYVIHLYLLHLPHSCQLPFFNTHFIALGNGKEKKDQRKVPCSDQEETCMSQYRLYPEKYLLNNFSGETIKFAYF